jgi:hypothetical protein
MTIQNGKAKLNSRETEAYRLVVLSGLGGPGHRYLARTVCAGLENVIMRCDRYKDGIELLDHHGAVLGKHVAQSS